MKQVSIIGLGKLGSSMVAAFASKGFQVTGVDIDAEKIQLINEGKPPVFEPFLAEYLANNRERISATNSYEQAILSSDISFVILPTPTKEEIGFSNEYLLKSAEEIGKALAKKSSYHLVVFRSTVIPTSHENEIIPVLEKFSGKRCGVDFGFCFNPEFVALGSIINNILNPDFVLIGEKDAKSGEMLESFYREVCGENTVIKRMNIVNAELTKIALNTYVTTKISYSNMLAELCEKLPGGNIDVITDTLGFDKRIGHKYLKGALGYAGPCFPRDNGALIHTARKVGLELSLPRVTDEINDYQVTRMVNKVLEFSPKKVAVLGLTFKPDTNYVDPSQSLEIAKRLASNVSVVVYDPKGMDNARKILGNSVVYANSANECVSGADVVIVPTAWPEFKDIILDKGVTLIDCWRVLDKFKDSVNYVPLGINLSEKTIDWKTKNVLVTGGASFIGSHLVDALIKRGAKVRVIDDLSSGRIGNIREHIEAGRVEFIEADLREPGVAESATKNQDIVFHLAADHGGRGYVDLHQGACAGNLALDGIVFLACKKNGVEKIVYASSGCVYPNYIQNNPEEILYLTEDKAGPPYDSDNIYGWAKLMAEMTLRAYSKDFGMKTASCRYFTVYGERGIENHAVIAMIARAFVKQDPFEVWGTGEQIRNWTYVGDIVEGTILAAEKIDDGTAVNLGTMERTRVIDAVKEVMRYTGYNAEIKLNPDMPTGPYNRVADNSLAKELLGWEPKMKFFDGLHKTIDWYFANKNVEEVKNNFSQKLTER